MRANVIAVQEALHGKGMNPSDLRQFGFAPGTIAKLMKGEDLTPKTILKLANTLHVPMESIVKVEDPFYELLRDRIEKAVLIG